jgi:hypothetical protein
MRSYWGYNDLDVTGALLQRGHLYFGRTSGEVKSGIRVKPRQAKAAEEPPDTGRETGAGSRPQ